MSIPASLLLYGLIVYFGTVHTSKPVERNQKNSTATDNTSNPLDDNQTNSTTTDQKKCGQNPNCINWQRNGFCNNTFYPYEMRVEYCGQICGFCNV
ncbi:hypothetical protein RB195_002941 [Necator americanus]|uniref:ShKT domain-containing protein n=1 Tax=Necator americanus TaxID=51031 RepID=A0ABR1DLC5_NECAM